MHNHRLIPLVVLVTSLIALSSIAARAAAATAASPPNVVLIISDDQGWSDYGFMGHSQVETPRLDELARQSLTFRYGYVPTSLCRPSLATILTGQYAHQHQITGNDPREAPPAERRKLRDEQIAYLEQLPTLPRLLAPLGYASLQTGKWWEGNYRRAGFTYGMTHGDAERGGRHGDAGLAIGRDGIGPIREFLDASAGKPFFIWYAPMLPHNPHNPPERLLAKYRTRADSPFVARYWAMCEWFDETCGQLLDELASRDLARDTIVVYVTDNGWVQDPQQDTHDVRSKLSPYEGGVRTPIMIRWLGRVEPAIVDMPVSSIDLAPTILTAIGVETTAQMPGINLLDDRLVAERETIFGEVFTHDAVNIKNPAASLKYRWCLTTPWKLIVPNPELLPNEEARLFNVLADPWEHHDFAAAHPEIVSRLHQQLDRWWPGRQVEAPE